MPTLLRQGSLRFFFYSNEGAEAPHVHVEDTAISTSRTAKFWLDPVRLVVSVQSRPSRWRHAEQLVVEHQQDFLRAWNEFFSLK